MYAKYRAFGETAADKVIGGAELVSTRTATTVRVRDGQTLVTDGASRSRWPRGRSAAWP